MRHLYLLYPDNLIVTDYKTPVVTIDLENPLCAWHDDRLIISVRPMTSWLGIGCKGLVVVHRQGTPCRHERVPSTMNQMMSRFVRGSLPREAAEYFFACCDPKESNYAHRVRWCGDFFGERADPAFWKLPPVPEDLTARLEVLVEKFIVAGWDWSACLEMLGMVPQFFPAHTVHSVLNSSFKKRAG